MSTRTVTTLACDHCGHTAHDGHPMLQLQNVVLSGGMHVGTPAVGLSLHACSVGCATALVPAFLEGGCAMPQHARKHGHMLPTPDPVAAAEPARPTPPEKSADITPPKPAKKHSR